MLQKTIKGTSLQATLPLENNEELYARITGIPVDRLQEISKEIKTRKAKKWKTFLPSRKSRTS